MGYPEKRGAGKDAYYRARYKAPDGTYPAVKDEAGNVVRFRTKKQAQDAADDADADIRANRWIDPKGGAMTLAQWYEQWIPAQEYGSTNTEKTYAQHWRKHIEPRWGRMPLGEIRPIHIQAWEKELGASYARPTVVSITAPFRRMLEDAFANGLITRSALPAKKRASKRNHRESAGVAVPLGTWEAICARLPAAHALMARTVYWTGMRFSEVTAMRARFLTLTPATDGHPAAGVYYLHPDVGAAHKDAAEHRHYGPPKSGPGREWQLPPFLAQQLIDHVARLPAPGPRVAPDDRDLIFPDHVGRPHSASNFTRTYWRPACDGRAESATRRAWEPVWPGLRLHDGKHSHGAMLDDLGVHRVMRDYRLGHSDGSARSAYEHPTPDMRRLLLDGLQARWEAWAAEAETFSPDSPRDLFEYAGIQVG
jgi:integrase